MPGAARPFPYLLLPLLALAVSVAEVDVDAMAAVDVGADADAQQSDEIDIHAPPPPPDAPPLLLQGRKYPLNFAAGALQIHGTPLFVREVANSGVGTGHNVWDGAVQLAKYLEYTFPAGLAGKRIVELGAGTGVAGLAAAMLGADVLLTDLPYALDNLRECVRLNRGAVKGSVAVAAFDWAAPDASIAAMPDEQRALVHGVDIVLGADVVWVAELVPILVDSMRRLLASSGDEGGRRRPAMLLAHQTRSRESDALLFRSMRGAGLAFRAVEHELHHPQFMHPDIDVFAVELAPLE